MFGDADAGKLTLKPGGGDHNSGSWLTLEEGVWGQLGSGKARGGFWGPGVWSLGGLTL